MRLDNSGKNSNTDRPCWVQVAIVGSMRLTTQTAVTKTLLVPFSGQLPQNGSETRDRLQERSWLSTSHNIPHFWRFLAQ